MEAGNLSFTKRKPRPSIMSIFNLLPPESSKVSNYTRSIQTLPGRGRRANPRPVPPNLQKMNNQNKNNCWPTPRPSSGARPVQSRGIVGGSASLNRYGRGGRRAPLNRLERVLEADEDAWHHSFSTPANLTTLYDGSNNNNNISSPPSPVKQVLSLETVTEPEEDPNLSMTPQQLKNQTESSSTTAQQQPHSDTNMGHIQTNIQNEVEGIGIIPPPALFQLGSSEEDVPQYSVPVTVPVYTRAEGGYSNQCFTMQDEHYDNMHAMPWKVVADEKYSTEPPGYSVLLECHTSSNHSSSDRSHTLPNQWEVLSQFNSLARQKNLGKSKSLGRLSSSQSNLSGPEAFDMDLCITTSTTCWKQKVPKPTLWNRFRQSLQGTPDDKWIPKKEIEQEFPAQEHIDLDSRSKSRSIFKHASHHSQTSPRDMEYVTTGVSALYGTLTATCEMKKEARSHRHNFLFMCCLGATFGPISTTNKKARSRTHLSDCPIDEVKQQIPTEWLDNSIPISGLDTATTSL